MLLYLSGYFLYILGIISQTQPVCIVMELMELGDLKTFLRRHREDVDEPLPPLSKGKITIVCKSSEENFNLLQT